jgi:hypothetical protein
MEGYTELDRMAAESVLGWHMTGTDYDTPHGRRAVTSFHPSTDIRDAFELLESVRPRCHVVIIRWISADHWLVELSGYKQGRAGVARANSPLLPLAITEGVLQTIEL